MMAQSAEQARLTLQNLHIPLGIRQHCAKLHQTAQDVRTLGRLDGSQSKTLVSSAVRIMMTKQTVRPFQCYQEFLFDIHRIAGCSMVVLSSASLGKESIVRLKAGLRRSLVQYIELNQSLLESVPLSTLANDFKVPNKGTLSGEGKGQKAKCDFNNYLLLLIEVC
ncbi:hypothetical protein BDV25DRAFT_161509 [Aspergillus avenaceus]|uniref:Uncharacterized protein n=1 Tax=Aspergillus avenaceus TaxID=36643 RepID=A0A5N6TKT1_ASPAV|nr:hypothetical protein BDV25DRAFT_161509 [Aspergillus avenaceus]